MNKDTELMINKVIELMMIEQKDNGVLSKYIECEEEGERNELFNKVKENTSEETYRIFLELEDCLTGLLILYEDRAYKTGVLDGIKLSNSIKDIKG